MEPGPLRDRDLLAPASGNFPERLPRLRGRDRSGDRRHTVVGYWVVDDVGTVINPMLVKGQIMGGIAQGMGQVLMEDKGLRRGRAGASGSFMDYAMPRADDFVDVVIEDNPVPTPTNPLGVKGAGEAGTVGSLSAGVNAIVDALSVFGIKSRRHAVHALSGMAGDQERARGEIKRLGSDLAFRRGAFAAPLAHNAVCLSICGPSRSPPPASAPSSISIRLRLCCLNWRTNFMSARAKSRR